MNYRCVSSWETYIQTVSQQPGIFISGLSALFVSACYHMWDCHWKCVCCSANAECPWTRMDDDYKITLYLLEDIQRETWPVKAWECHAYEPRRPHLVNWTVGVGRYGWNYQTGISSAFCSGWSNKSLFLRNLNLQRGPKSPPPPILSQGLAHNHVEKYCWCSCFCSKCVCFSCHYVLNRFVGSLCTH